MPPITVEEVLAAIQSLYVDGLRPFGRILRKRMAEQLLAVGRGVQDIDMAYLRAVCAACTWLRVEDTEGGDWAATFACYPEMFVDIYSPEDPYQAELWQSAAAYFESLSDDNMVLPGGRYSCAQELMSRCLGFLSGYSLGQVSHIVQLAISQKRLLGYLNGAVVPYGRSGSRAKDQCAASQRPFAGAPCASGEPRLVQWEELRQGMQELMLRVPAGGSMPLSNVKRLFRSRYHMELSETALGHSKLSELLNDPQLQDVCSVRLQGHGYVVVHPHQRGLLTSSSSSIAAAPVPALPAPEEGSLRVGLGDARRGTSRRPSPADSEPRRKFEIKIRNTFVHVDDEPSADTPANKDLAVPKRAKTAPAPEALDPGSSDDDDDEDSVTWIPSRPAEDDADNVSDRSQAADGAGDGPNCSDSCSTGTSTEARLQVAGGCDGAVCPPGACAGEADGDPLEAQLEPMYLAADVEASPRDGARRLGLTPRMFVVQNTFVHVAPEPETPWAGAGRRARTTTNARSTAGDVGFGNV